MPLPQALACGSQTQPHEDFGQRAEPSQTRLEQVQADESCEPKPAEFCDVDLSVEMCQCKADYDEQSCKGHGGALCVHFHYPLSISVVAASYAENAIVGKLFGFQVDFGVTSL